MATPCFLFLIAVASAVSSIESASKSSNGSCIAAERAALLSFKAGITSDPDSVLVSWQPRHLNCCRWNGVTCSRRTGHVVKLDLRNRSPDWSYVFYPDEHSLCGQLQSNVLVLSKIRQLMVIQQYGLKMVRLRWISF
ncbi:hypothetical protein QYE76_055182 [Lolium multiflorum]|uniref:Leucine-rich repeat-containing N-terminal plant-type domain-containing protein n=1 Tax=Lolium multiflorum TaxID=4521 RepID=A0AAD8T0V8_LOLMU|nr:hypothetical protein QYE76_055182 [Lolium multiflorum]